MRKVLILFAVVFGVFAVVVLYWVGQGFMEGARHPAADPIDQRLVQMANELKSSLPRMLDSETRLDSVVTGPGKRVTYSYTLVRTSSGQAGVTSRLVTRLRPVLINAYRTTPSLAELRERNVELVHAYRDRNGTPLVTIAVSPKDF